jgi:hypothetical protein
MAPPISRTWAEELDPDEQKDYGVDWSRYLGSALIASSPAPTIEVEAGVTKLGEALGVGAQLQAVRLTGGTPGQSYSVRFTISHDSTSELFQRTLYVKVADL